MKKILAIAASLVALLPAQGQMLPPVQISLLWDYNILEAGDLREFRIYYADTVPDASDPLSVFPMGWSVLTTVSAAPIMGTYSYTEQVVPGQRYYTITAVNFWGLESLPSNAVHTPAAVRPARPLTLRIFLPNP
jgi:hypothetical protein